MKNYLYTPFSDWIFFTDYNQHIQFDDNNCQYLGWCLYISQSMLFETLISGKIKLYLSEVSWEDNLYNKTIVYITILPFKEIRLFYLALVESQKTVQ